MKIMKKAFSMLVIILLLSTSVEAKMAFNRQNFPAQVIVTGGSVNVRSGPSTAFVKVGIVYKGNILECVGKLGGWYVVHLNNDTVGLISNNYSKDYYPPTTTPAPTATPAPSGTTTATAEELQMLSLVNTARKANGLPALTMDKDLLKLARLKSKDMVNLNYFSHTSPTYGSPFQMLNDFGIKYRTAGENLAGNSSVSTAHTSLMNSPGHRANILNASFTIVGIGVVNSPRYGKIITQLFVGR